MQNTSILETPQASHTPAGVTLESIRRIAIEIAGYLIAVALAALLALWIYGAWLDIQPPAKPKVWLDKPRNNICYFTRDTLFCVPE